MGATIWRISGTPATNILATPIASTTMGGRVAAEADNAFRVIPNGGSNLTAGTFTLYGMTEV